MLTLSISNFFIQILFFDIKIFLYQQKFVTINKKISINYYLLNFDIIN